MPEVIVRKGEPVDRALKRLKSKLDAEGILAGVDLAVCGGRRGSRGAGRRGLVPRHRDGLGRGGRLELVAGDRLDDVWPV